MPSPVERKASEAAVLERLKELEDADHALKRAIHALWEYVTGRGFDRIRPAEEIAADFDESIAFLNDLEARAIARRAPKEPG